MANLTEEKLRVSVDDQTAAGLNSAKGNVQGLRKSVNKMGSSFKANAGTILAATASITGGILAIKKAFDFADEFARFQQNQVAFNSQVTALGANAITTFKRIKEASGGLIDNNALLKSANLALSLGINVNLLGDMLEVSRAKARDMGITTQEAFEKLTIALARGSKLRLDDLGIIIDSAKANEKLAESIGKTVSELTDQDKALAFQTEALNLGREALERYDLEQNTLTENLQAFKATMANARVEAGAFALKLGTGLTAVLQGLQATVLGLAGTFLAIPTALAKMTDALGVTENAALDWEIQMKASFDAANEKATQAENNMALALSSTTELLAAQEAALKRPAPVSPDAIDTPGSADELARLEEEAQKKRDEEARIADELRTKREAEQMRARFRFAVQDNNARIAMERNRISTTASLADTLFQLTGKKNRELFTAHKLFASAQVAIDTSRAVTAALANPPGPPFTFGVAALAAARGALQLQQINSTSLGGGSTAPSFGGGGGGGVAAPPVPVAPPSQDNIVVTLRVVSEGPSRQSIIDNTIVELQEGLSDGRVILDTPK